MRNVQAPDKIDTWRVVCAAQSEPDYSEDRQILYYGGDEGDYHGNGPFIVLDGSHQNIVRRKPRPLGLVRSRVSSF